MTDNKAKALLSEEIEAKAKLFSQYVYQVVLIDPHNPFVKPLYLVPDDFEFRTNLKFPDYSLQLRSVSDLTDEEAIEVAKLLNIRGLIDIESNSALRDTNIRIVRRLLNQNDTFTRTIDITLAVTDYLRAIGCLIRFTYLTSSGPITLSTEEIIKRGWAQVKSKDNGQ